MTAQAFTTYVSQNVSRDPSVLKGSQERRDSSLLRNPLDEHLIAPSSTNGKHSPFTSMPSSVANSRKTSNARGSILRQSVAMNIVGD